MIGKVINNFTYFMTINIQDFIKHSKELTEPQFAKISWLNKTVHTKSDRLRISVFKDDIDITFKINLISSRGGKDIYDYLGEVHIHHQIIIDEYQTTTQDIMDTVIKFKDVNGVIEQTQKEWLKHTTTHILIDLNNPNLVWVGDDGDLVVEKVVLSLLDENFR